MKDNPIKVTREEAIKIIKKALEKQESLRKDLEKQLASKELVKKGSKVEKAL